MARTWSRRRGGRDRGADQEETRALLQEMPRAYHTQINDAAARRRWPGASARWTGEPRSVSTSRGTAASRCSTTWICRGRSAGSPRSSRCGWRSGRGRPGRRAQARSRSSSRRVPNRGVGYGVLRYLAPTPDGGERCARCRTPRSASTIWASSTAARRSWQLAAGERGAARARRRAHLIEVNALIAGGRLRVDWEYSAAIIAARPSSAVAGGFLRRLRRL